MASVSGDVQFLRAGMDFLAKSTDLKKTIAELVRLASAACGSDMGTLYLLDRRHRVLKPFAIVNLPPEYIEGCETVGLGEQCCGRAALHKIPWIVEDMWSDPLFKPCRDASKRAGVRAAFSTPVLDSRGECLGSLGCHFRETYRPSEYALERAKLFSQLIAFAIARYEADQATQVMNAAD